jgi:hypothetical protein
MPYMLNPTRVNLKVEATFPAEAFTLLLLLIV